MDLSEKRQALLQKYLQGKRGDATRPVIARRGGDAGPAPLSWPQQQIWSHSQLAGDAPIYNEPITIHRRGELDRAALERAFTEIVRRHEAWRTVFRWEGNEPIQIVQPPPERIQIPFLDLRGHSEPEAEALRLATEDALQPFELGRGPLYRLRLVRLAEDDHRFFLTLHHIIFDGVSLYRILLPELIECYEAFRRGRAPVLPALPIQYPDFAAWQRATPISPEQLEYWEEILRDLPVLDLPGDHPRPAIQRYEGEAVVFALPETTNMALKAIGQEHGATPFMVMVAAFTALLHAYTGGEETVIGGISSGRNRSETRQLLGCFLNTVAIRTAIDPCGSFIDHLARVRQATLGALSHDQTPFQLVVEKFAGPRDPGRAPLFQVLIVVEPPLESLGEGWGFTHMDVDPGTAKFDLQLGLDDRPEGVTGRFIYNRALFERATIETMKDRWLELLARISLSPNDSIQRLTNTLLTGGGKQPPPSWNGLRTPYPRNATIQSLFEEQVARAPASTALVFGKEELTYGEVNRRANQLAWRLRQRGISGEVPTGIFLERSIEVVIAILAILKAGGVYVPLDPVYPGERIDFMIDDTQMPLVLTKGGSRRFRACDVLDLEEEALGDESESNLPEDGASGGSLACIIYTSGSTGRPKGVAVPHRAIVRLVRGTDYASFSPNETFLLLAPISFDASTFEIFGPLLNGGRLVVMGSGRPSLEEIGAAIREHGVTTLWLTAGLFNAMVDERLGDLRPLRQLLAGGDVLSVGHVAKALRGLPGTRLINGYGPTENTTFACCHTIDPLVPLGASVPIGRPIANTTAHILDPQLQPVAIGVTGELFLGGDGIARGYWRRPELTAEKFLPDPFSGESGSRLYRTGDLARWCDEGTIEFLGRRDTQVKVRGFRIELGEIENRLRQQPGVDDAAAIVREDLPNEKRLVAYVVGEAAEPALLGAMKASLPDYLVPSAIVRLAALPRTPNGKLDRAALPPPGAGDEKTVPFFEPRTPLEKKIAGIWMSLLGLQKIGTRDNFFDLGGHSLLGLRLVNQLRQGLDEPLSVVLVFEAPTVATMAELLQRRFPAAVARWLGQPAESSAAASPVARPLAPVVRVDRRTREQRERKR
jgi:amino acid adenylation domain-containing protein